MLRRASTPESRATAQAGDARCGSHRDIECAVNCLHPAQLRRSSPGGIERTGHDRSGKGFPDRPRYRIIGIVRIVIEGRDLPGSVFCDPDGLPLNDVRVGAQVRADAVDLVRGDAQVTLWDLDVMVIVDPQGGFDFRGPAVHGKRAERFLYLTWGNVTDGNFAMFRRAKLVLNQIDPKVVSTALTEERPLVGMIRLTDPSGSPMCGRVKPPDLVWQVR
jgi:Family of unknown function (DUF5990)